MVRVEHIKDGISVHLLTSSVDANLKVGEGTFDQLLQERSLEDTDLDQAVLVMVTKRSHEIWDSSRAVDLIDLNVNRGRCMDQSLIHV